MAVFLRLGYGAATMELVAAEAGVSKQTVYNNFQSKEGLFKAIIEDLSTGLVAQLELREPAQATPAQVLGAFGRDFLELMLRPSSLALYRLIVAESARFPELGGPIYEVGAGQLIAMLAGYLGWETKAHRLRVDAPEEAAEQFLGMLTGRIQLRALLAVGPAPTARDLQRRAERAASDFLTLYAARRGEAGT